MITLADLSGVESSDISLNLGYGKGTLWSCSKNEGDGHTLSIIGDISYDDSRRIKWLLGRSYHIELMNEDVVEGNNYTINVGQPDDWNPHEDYGSWRGLFKSNTHDSAKKVPIVQNLVIQGDDTNEIDIYKGDGGLFLRDSHSFLIQNSSFKNIKKVFDSGGGLVGSMSDASDRECIVMNSFTEVTDDLRTGGGGLVGAGFVSGVNNKGVIMSCHSQVDIDSNFTSGGGLCGKDLSTKGNCVIMNSYAKTSALSGLAGGLVGENAFGDAEARGVIVNCYAKTLALSGSAGGIIGSRNGSVGNLAVINTYYKSNVLAVKVSDSGTFSNSFNSNSSISELSFDNIFMIL